MEKTEDLVLLKLFINGNTVKTAYKKPYKRILLWNDATQLTPLAHERNSIFKINQHLVYNPRGTRSQGTIAYKELFFIPIKLEQGTSSLHAI